ncbi:uncharacterized protein LOC121635462 isoform X2 [Melanotaenia boesemani]|uniref:uncharacterized protein LOC121635462 isoform X2 n=1 Tax=Melanotaenia boesemani TaxID=1250792 RepID=UPI001C05B439|nr:uncharacterized protein LOC121635462 isoform X2 [Melanotaenia boesemani]
MEALKLCFVLLLPQTVCFENEVILVKTVGTETDVTPLCTNETLDLIACKMRPERMGGEECRLLYQYGHNFINECGSKFNLVTINQTVFLHLSSLTPADGGKYTCECVNLSGTFTYHLNITVEENEAGSFTEDTFPRAWVGVVVFFAVTSAILGFFYKKLHHRVCLRSDTPDSFDEADPDETYTSLQQPDGELYHTIFPARHRHDAERNSAGRAATFSQNSNQMNPNCEIYENI